MLQGRGAKIFHGLAAGVIGAIIAVVFFAPGWLDRWEAKTWDWRVNLLAKPSPATQKIRLVLLDQNSLDWAREENGLSWPWPREVYGTIIRFCKRAGATSLAFDVLFTEPSKYGVADDRALASEIQNFDNFAGAVFLSRKSGSEKKWPEAVPLPSFNIQGLDEWIARTGHETFPRASFPVEEIAKAAGSLPMFI